MKCTHAKYVWVDAYNSENALPFRPLKKLIKLYFTFYVAKKNIAFYRLYDAVSLENFALVPRKTWTTFRRSRMETKDGWMVTGKSIQSAKVLTHSHFTILNSKSCARTGLSAGARERPIENHRSDECFISSFWIFSLRGELKDSSTIQINIFTIQRVHPNAILLGIAFSCLPIITNYRLFFRLLSHSNTIKTCVWHSE